jgi:hypothetical protein
MRSEIGRAGYILRVSYATNPFSSMLPAGGLLTLINAFKNGIFSYALPPVRSSLGAE